MEQCFERIGRRRRQVLQNVRPDGSKWFLSLRSARSTMDRKRCSSEMWMMPGSDLQHFQKLYHRRPERPR
jgi:hypothetical protein